MATISVIITIHNSEQFLRECMESVLSQTFSDIEILCIDGGSTDKSPIIVEEYCKTDNRVRKILDPNTSYGHKINRGIVEAKGQYVAVLESDDYYDVTMLNDLYEIAERENVDFVNANYTSFFDIEDYRFSRIVRMYNHNEYNRTIDYGDGYGELGNISRFWTGLFKKDFILENNIFFNESPGASYQDMSFRFLTSVLCKRVYHLDKSVYWYRIDNPASSIHDSSKTVAIADEHVFLRNELLKRKITDERVWHDVLEWKYQDFFGNMAFYNMEGENRDALFRRYRHELEKDRDLIIRYRVNGYNNLAECMMNDDAISVRKSIQRASLEYQEELSKLNSVLTRCCGAEKENGIVIFGCGRRGKDLLEYLVSACFQNYHLCDNSKEIQGNKIYDKTIYSISVILAEHSDALFVVASKYGFNEMRKQLLDYGIDDSKIVLY